MFPQHINTCRKENTGVILEKQNMKQCPQFRRWTLSRTDISSTPPRPVVPSTMPQVRIDHFSAWAMSERRIAASLLKSLSLHGLLLSCGSHLFFLPSIFFSNKERGIFVHSENQSSAANWPPHSCGKRREKHTVDQRHIESGATRQQVVLSLRRGPWALGWNGHRASLLWDERRRRCCLWSGWVAEYWAVTKAEAHGSTCPLNFTADVRFLPRVLVAVSLFSE